MQVNGQSTFQIGHREERKVKSVSMDGKSGTTTATAGVVDVAAVTTAT